ncbi:S8 family peptidase [Rhizobium leguminosarum]
MCPHLREIVAIFIFSFFYIPAHALDPADCSKQFGAAELSGAGDDRSSSLVFRWKADYKSKETASEQLTDLYISLHNAGKLPTGFAIYDPATPLDTFVRQQQFWIGTPTQAMDALLCDLNKHVCTRDRPTAEHEPDDLLGHLAGTEITQARWLFRSSIGSLVCLRVPAVSINIGEELAGVSELGQPLESPTVGAPIVAEFCKSTSLGKICFPQVVSGKTEKRVNDFFISGSKSPSRNSVWVREFTADLAIPRQPLPFYRENTQGEYPKTFPFAKDFYDADNSKLRKSIGTHLSPVFSTFDVESVFGDTKTAIVDPGKQEYIYRSTSGLMKWQGSGHLRSVIGVIDTAAHLNHCDFDASRLVNKEDFSPYSRTSKAPPKTVVNPAGGSAAACSRKLVDAPDETQHGTHILGMFLARPPNVTEQALVRLENYGVVYYPLDMLSMRGSGPYRDDLAKWIKQAGFVGGVSVFNISWSYSPDLPGQDAYRDPIADAIKSLKDASLFVVAAGKDGVARDGSVLGQQGDNCSPLPACYNGDNVISVVALEDNDKDGAEADVRPISENGTVVTNTGSKFFSISAPGRNIVSSVETDQYGPMTGSSQATPFVSAAAAQLFSSRKIPPVDVKERLIVSSEIKPSLLDVSLGGIVSVPRALSWDADYFKEANGCEFSADRTRLQNANSSLAPLAFDGDLQGTKEIEWNSIKRLVSLGDNRYLMFYEDENDNLVRETGYIAAPSSNAEIRVHNVKQKINCDGRDLYRVKIADIVDFLPGLQR